MKKLPNFKASFITETFFSDVPRKNINKGRCFAWAYLAFKIFDGVELWDTWGHAFIKYRGKFYDSDRPRGEKDWRDLPANKAGHSIAKRRSAPSFKLFWHGNPETFGFTWNSLDKQAKETLHHGGYH
jgi:hypothetical protein